MSQDVGKLIEGLVKAKAELAQIKLDEKAKRQDIEAIKLEIRDALGAVGLSEGRNLTHSARVSEVLVPQAVDWDQAYGYIHENKYYHLLHRRLSVEGCRELWAAGLSIPGVEQFKDIDISLRKV